MADTPALSARYGPWALVAGASDGVGSAFAHAFAEHGLNVVLVSRRPALLEEVAHDIRSRHGVETRCVAVDLADAGAAAELTDTTTGLEVGMFVYCAGADPYYEEFLDLPVADALAMVQRNCVAPLQLCHTFAAPMRDRGRGGIILLSSGAVIGGGVNRVTYSATKAFDMVLAEGLWAELEHHGVDVLSLVLSVTDTPALRTLLVKRGNLAHPDDGTPIPGAATPEEVVAEALANLSDNGPVWFVGQEMRDGAKAMGGMGRSESVRIMKQMGDGVMSAKLS